MKTFVLGDVHGAHAALLQCLERSGFDRGHDRLIALGDVCDVCPDVRACVDELIAIPGCEYIIGNHDVWALGWALRGDAPKEWLSAGGEQTVRSYGCGGMPQRHVDFFNAARQWIEDGKRLFVHAGFDPDVSMHAQSLRVLAYDRSFLKRAHGSHEAGDDIKFGSYDEIFVGHTPTDAFASTLPICRCNVWAVDTGAGWGGPLTIMDVDSKEYWQSDPVSKLYPGCGRKGKS